LKIKIVIIVFLLNCVLYNLQAQSKFTLSGYVRDGASGEDLIGVTVYISSLKSGVITNVYGFYSLTLPQGGYTVQYSYLGYVTYEQKINLVTDLTYNIDLGQSTKIMEEIVIAGEAADINISGLEMSVERLNLEQIKKMPALFGEPDLIKAVQMLPGVISAGEGTSAYFVRGGSADQNLILIDEAPIYDPSHLFGYISVFNADIIKDSKLYKGGIPASYGGRLSSILDVRTIDGNDKKFAAHAGIGTLASKVMIEGPFKRKLARICSQAEGHMLIYF